MEAIETNPSVEDLYKSLMNRNDLSLNLSSFVRQAESFNLKASDYDVIKIYLHTSGNCKEILLLVKDISTIDSQIAVLIMQALYHILCRVTDDLHIFSSVGIAIINDVLLYGMKTIFNFLKVKQKSSRTKLALSLLTAMVDLGGQTANKIVSKLDFSSITFTHLLNRKHFSAEEDIRSMFIKLIASILTNCDFNVVLRLVEMKGFLNDILPGLVSDRVYIIKLILGIFQVVIVKNSLIPKTTKLRLFNDHSLKSVVNLYSWKGPVRTGKGFKRKLGEAEQTIAYEVSEEDIESVHQCAHGFMLSLFSCFKTGIIFRDPSFGTSGRNANHVLTNVLIYMPKPHTNKLSMDFVLNVMKMCPDQMTYYLPRLKDSLMPRLSSLWVDAVCLVKEIIFAIDPVSCLFKSQEKKPVPVLINIAKALCLPSIISPVELSDLFKNGNVFICHYLCELLTCILNQVRNINEFCIGEDILKTSYSSADISSFSQSFLFAIFQNFSFVKDFEDFWEKLTVVQSNTFKEIAAKGLTVPSLSDQLLNVLEVIQLFQYISHHCYNQYDVNVTKLFQSLRGCCSLSEEEKCLLNIKIVDVVARHGEQTMTLWNKHLIDSPLMILLDVYLTCPSEEIVENLSQILHKVLLHTKMFDYCPWEIDIWLELMKASKEKNMPFIIEFINKSVYTLLQNPSLFVDDMVENTIGECKSRAATFDVVTMLNDLLSKENDPVLIEDSEEFTNASEQKQHFSCLVPASLYTLHLLDADKRKGCEKFVEQVLCQIMHRQQVPEVLYSLIQKYKANISIGLNQYFELLCHYKHEKVLINDSAQFTCSKHLSTHLKARFLTLHLLQNSANGCQCDLQCNAHLYKSSYLQRIVWQLLLYIDFETNLLLKDETVNVAVLNYINLLGSILDSLNQPDTDHLNDIVKDSAQHKEKSDFLNEVLSHPAMLKLFLWVKNVPKSKRTLLKGFVNNMTELILKLATQVLPVKEYNNSLTEFKDKVIKFSSILLQTLNVQRKIVMSENSDISNMINIFSPLFSSNDIINIFESLLNLDTTTVKFEFYFSTLVSILDLYINLKDSSLLSPTAINSLIVRYISFSNEQKGILRDYILKIFDQHAALAYAVEAGSCHLLLKQNSSNNFYILGCLIESCERLRHTIQLAVFENIETLKNTPDIIFLVSKCILNSALNEAEDINFQEKICMFFWEAIINHILTNISESDDLLEKCGADKALQILFEQNLLSKKKLSKFFKLNEVSLKTFPHSSKMCVFLQLLEIIKDYILEMTKTSILILKIVFHWIFCIISSVQSSSDTDHFPLLEFSHILLQNVPEMDFKDVIENGNFIPKLLKVSLKYGEIGIKLFKILSVLCQKSRNFNLPSKLIFNLITGHSNFFHIMLSEEKDEKLKECLIDLLIILVEIDKSLCKENHVGLFLASYTGSLKCVDQKLLYLIKLYSESEVDMVNFSPFLWSKAAIAHYSILNSGTMHLWKKPKLQDVLNIFLMDNVITTVEKYPLTLKLKPSISDLDDSLEDWSQAYKIYDLRFFLPLFSNLLSPGAYVHCQSFLKSGVLMMIFTSLSSFDTDTRALGYYCLTQFYNHLEGSTCKDKQIWLSLLDSLRYSIDSENPRIPSIISLFLARVSHIFEKPDHPMFTVLYQFILVKPNLDIGHVPEFYKLFNSIENEHRIQRMWILELLVDGIRSSLDFHICEKRYIFSQILLPHYLSPISSPEEKLVILKILTAAVKVETSIRILSQNSLIEWLHYVIKETDRNNFAVLKCLCTLLKSLWSTFSKLYEEHIQNTQDKNTKDNLRIFYNSFPEGLLFVLFEFLNKIKVLEVFYVNTYLTTLLEVIIFLKNNPINVIVPSALSIEHINQIIDSWLAISEGTNPKVNKTVENKNNASDLKHCHFLLSKIVLLWSPNWNYVNEHYNNQLTTVLRAVELVLQFHDASSLYISDLPAWLLICFEQDEKHEFAKLFLSIKGEICLQSILELFEKSVKVQNKVNSTKANINLSSNRRGCTVKQWKKILLYFKKVCRLYNIVPELNIYHQITMIL